MAFTPDLLTIYAEEIRACVCAALEETECGCPCRNGITVGETAWDDCCAGQLWVAVERVYPMRNFPEQELGVITCGADYAADFVIGHLLCAPTVKDDGSAPTAPEIATSAAKVYEAAFAILNSLACCLLVAHRHRKFRILEQRFLGPEGGCVGSQTRFTLELIDPPPA